MKCQVVHLVYAVNVSIKLLLLSCELFFIEYRKDPLSGGLASNNLNLYSKNNYIPPKIVVQRCQKSFYSAPGTTTLISVSLNQAC